MCVWDKTATGLSPRPTTQSLSSAWNQSLLPETQFSHLGKEHGNSYLIGLLLRFKGMWKVTSLPAWHTSRKPFSSHPNSLPKEGVLYSYPRKSREKWSYCANLMGHTLRNKGGREKKLFKKTSATFWKHASPRSTSILTGQVLSSSATPWTTRAAPPGRCRALIGRSHRNLTSFWLCHCGSEPCPLRLTFCICEMVVPVPPLRILGRLEDVEQHYLK